MMIIIIMIMIICGEFVGYACLPARSRSFTDGRYMNDIQPTNYITALCHVINT